MSKIEEINLAKQQFVSRFPITNGAKDCARYGVDAAVGRSHLYSPNTNHLDIREYWIKQLIIIGKKYKDTQTLETFKSDILALKELMNSKFPGRFNNGHADYDNEFRIAHAQKSLSIFLKHMWCNNLITVLPPVCPIDGVILKYCRSNDSWTKVNSIDSYEKHLAIVKNQRKIDNIESLPEWEVWTFYRKTSRKEKKVENRRKRKGHSIESTSMDITDEFINEIKTQFPTIKLSRNKSISHGPKSELIADLSDGWRLAVGRKKTYYFCGMYTKERRENKYPDILGNPVGGGYGYFSKFQTAEEALRQFDNILQTENSIDD